MRLRTRLNLVVAALSAAFVIVLIAAELQSTRTQVREEIEAANRVASQLLGRLAGVYSRVGGPDLVLQFLDQLGRVRANEVTLESSSGEILYRSPPAPYKAGREWKDPAEVDSEDTYSDYDDLDDAAAIESGKPATSGAAVAR